MPVLIRWIGSRNTNFRILSKGYRRGICDCGVVTLKCVNEVTIDNSSVWFMRNGDKTQFFTRLRVTAIKPVKLEFYVVFNALQGDQRASHHGFGKK